MSINRIGAFKNMANDLKLSPLAEELLNNMQGGVSKSFETGYNHGGEDQTDAAALRRQSLADDVKNLTFGNEDFTIFPIIPRIQAVSSVEEYAVQNGYGESGASRFVRESAISSINDPQLERKVVKMKMISDTKRNSLLSSIVNNLASPEQILQQSAIQVIAKTIEYGIFYGDADLSSVGPMQGIQFDGLKKLAAKENIIDARGEVLTEQHLNRAAVLIGKGFGTASDVFLPLGTLSEFINNQLNRQWITQATGVDESGFALNKFVSTRGSLALHGSTIMDKDLILDESYAGRAGAPSAPLSVEATEDAGKGAKFADSDITEPLQYKVRTVGDAGYSVAVAANVQVAKKDSAAKLSIKLPNISQATPEFVEIYRQDVESGMFYLVGRVGAYLAEAGVITFSDVNDVIPGTTDVFVMEMTARTTALYELLPMMKLDLAIVDASRTTSYLWYGALGVFAPKRISIIKNVLTTH